MNKVSNEDLKTLKPFEEFFEEECLTNQRFYCSFQGIKRKEYPKWLGWNYIDSLKGITNVSEIDSELMILLVENFYIVKYLHLLLGFSDVSEIV